MIKEEEVLKELDSVDPRGTIRYRIVRELREFALQEAEVADTPIKAAGMFAACVDSAVRQVQDVDPELAKRIYFCLIAAATQATKKQSDNPAD